MLGHRAARIVNTPGESSGSAATIGQKVSTANFSELQRVSRWKKITLRVLMVLRVYAAKLAAKTVLGDTVYRRLFQQVPTQTAQDAQPWWIVQGEVVGKPLKKSVSKATPQVDEKECSHPDEEMMKRANGKFLWWTCRLCHARWERPGQQTPWGPPTDEELMVAGRHKGKTFAQIVHQDTEYCEWVRMTNLVEDWMSPHMARFAEYLQLLAQVEQYQMEEDL